MTDKELLEYAALAAGYELQQGYGEPPEHCLFIVDAPGFDDGCVDWNPLRDDGDALRLAVKLGIDLLFSPEDVEAVAAQNAKETDGEMLAPWAWESWTLKNQDPNAAARRAIVRAAAELGKDMK